MKNLIIVLFSFLALEMNANCFNKDSKWEYLYLDTDIDNSNVYSASVYTHEFGGDTVINEVKYSKLLRNNKYYVAAIREDANGAIYAFMPDENKELLLFDFDWKEGKILYCGKTNYCFTSDDTELVEYAQIDKIEKVQLADDRTYNFIPNCIQGIGFLSGEFYDPFFYPFNNTCMPQPDCCDVAKMYLIRYSIGDELIYENQDLINKYLLAQSWFSEGSNWYYSVPTMHGSELYEQLSVGGDSVINNIKCKKIISYWASENEGIQTDGVKMLAYESNDSVFFYNDELKCFNLIYNFSAKQGDKYYVYALNNKGEKDSILVEIAAIENKQINGKNVKSQTIKYVEDNYEVTDEVLEHIGSVTYLNPFPKVLGGYDMIIPNPLRCFENEFYGHYDRGIAVSCDYIHIEDYRISVSETQTLDFTISPNPAGESFEIKVDDIENIASISLFDEVGKLVKRLPIENTISVDCASLPSGVYVCQIVDKQGVVTKKQVIVK